jgi:uncharacterized protein
MVGGSPVMSERNKLSALIKRGKVYVWKGTFAVVRSTRPLRGAVAVIRDKTETTCVIDSSRRRPDACSASEPGWKIITFDLVLPFELVGFMAAVTAALAKAGVSIFALSAYSTDHILVKSRDLDRALGALKKIGFIVDDRER